MKRHRFLVSITSLFGLGFCFTAHAQSYTDPVGAVAQEIVQGNQLISVPFQQPVSYQGVVTSISSSLIGLSDVPALPDPCYLQVLTGIAEGQVSTIVSFDASSVSLESEIGNLSIGDTIAIHPHIKLSDFTTYIKATDGDLITVYNPDGSSVTAEFFTGFGWYDALTDTIVDELIVFPGEGVVLNAVSARSAVFYGSVNTAPVIQFSAGSGVVNLIGTLNPVGGQTIGSIFDNANTGDLLTFYNTLGGSLQSTATYEFFDGFGWYDAINDLIVDNESISTGDAVVFQSTVDNSANHSSSFPN